MKMATGHPEGGEAVSGLSVERRVGFSEEDPAQDLLPRKRGPVKPEVVSFLCFSYTSFCL